METAELFQIGAAVVAAGALSGLLAGMFGVGGGAVIVPVLYQAFTVLGVEEAVRMHIAIGSSAGIIVPTSIRSYLAHRGRGTVDADFLRDWRLVVPLGTVVAALVAAVMSGEALRGVFATLTLVVGLRLILNRDDWRLGQTLPGNPVRALAGGVVGFTSALMGIGGGILTSTFMTLFGRPIHQAVATSAGVGVLISVPAVVGFIWAGWGVAGLPPASLGYLSLPALALVVPVSVATSPLGARLAHRLSPRRLEIGFGIFLLLVASRFVVSLV